MCVDSEKSTYEKIEQGDDEDNPEELPVRLRLFSLMTTGIANVSVQYNFGSIAPALIFMSTVECTLSEEECRLGEQALWVTGSATMTVFAGAFSGQLCMGYAGDVIGRNQAMRLTIGVAAISALLSAILPSGSPITTYATIMGCRFLLGVGLGGVFPLSAVKAAEDGAKRNGANDEVDSFSSSLAQFWQTIGTMIPWIAAICLTFSNLQLAWKWRLLLGLGCIPSAFVFSCSLCESYLQRYEILQSRSVPPAIVPVTAADAAPQLDATSPAVIIELLRGPVMRKKLWATGGTWFLYNICYYGVNLFGGQIVDAISNHADDTVSSDSSVRETAVKQLMALSAGVPAVVLAILLLKPMGTKRLQIVGFIFIAACFLLMAAAFQPLKNRNPRLLFLVYCLLTFSLSFGPNVSCFVLPAVTYPKNIRSTFNGISAALGKLGAVVGVYMFGPIAELTSYPTVMVICAAVSLAGAAVSQMCIETAGETGVSSLPQPQPQPSIQRQQYSEIGSETLAADDTHSWAIESEKRIPLANYRGVMD